MFVGLSTLITSVLGLMITNYWEKVPPLKPRHSPLVASAHVYVNKKNHALYFYEPCDLFCFVVRPSGMHSINFIETRYLEMFAYV